MYVPNFVPEPLEVPQNVTTAPYRERVRFLRRTLNWHAGSVLLAAGVSFLWKPFMEWRIPLAILVVSLLVLDAWRIRSRGHAIEAKVSQLALVPIAILAGCVLQGVNGFPGWCLVIGSLSVTLYANLCGRDFSFPAAFLSALLGSSAVIAAIDIQRQLSPATTAVALAMNGIFLLYLVYDLASLQARRHTDETMAAAVDLYRDVFNIFGYVPRVIAHWRRHRIWDVVREDMLRTWNEKGLPGAPK